MIDTSVSGNPLNLEVLSSGIRRRASVHVRLCLRLCLCVFLENGLFRMAHDGTRRRQAPVGYLPYLGKGGDRESLVCAVFEHADKLTDATSAGLIAGLGPN